MEKLLFIRNFVENDQIRASFNQLANNVFGIVLNSGIKKE